MDESAISKYTEMVNLHCSGNAGDVQITSNISTIKDVIQDSLQMSADVIALVTECLDQYCDMLDSKQTLCKIGEVWIKIGLVNIHLLAPKGQVDPVEKLAVKIKLMKEEVCV